MDRMAPAHETIRFSIVIRPEDGLFLPMYEVLLFFQGGGEGRVFDTSEINAGIKSCIHVQLPIDPGRTLFQSNLHRNPLIMIVVHNAAAYTGRLARTAAAGFPAFEIFIPILMCQSLELATVAR